MAVIAVFLPVNTLTILQKEGLSPLNRYILYIHLIYYYYTFLRHNNRKLNLTFASFSTVPHASLQEVNDLGNSQSEAAVEGCNNLN